MKKITALMVLAAIFICGTAFASEAIKIGFIGPLTGGVAFYGVSVKNGVDLYTKLVNEAGGLRGHQIELISYDDRHDPTESLNAYNRLVTRDEVAAIIGPVTSGPTFGVAQASADDNIPAITASASHPDVTSFGDNFFRACFEDPFQARGMARFAREMLNAGTAAVIYDVTMAYSTGLYESFIEAAAEIGLEIVAVESYSTEDVDFSTQLTNIAATNPDVLFIPDYYNKVYLICQQARQAGLNAIPLGVDGAGSWQEMEDADFSVFDGLYYASAYFGDDPAEIVANFRANYVAEFGGMTPPNMFEVLGYDAAAIMYDAIGRAIDAGVEIGATEESYQAIIDMLKSTDLECVTGHITFDENNNPVKEITVIKIVDGVETFEAKL